MKPILISLFLCLSTISLAQRGFKTDLGLNVVENNRALQVIEHDRKFYCSGEHFDTLVGSWNAFIAIYDFDGRYIKHHFVKNDTVPLVSHNNYINYDSTKYSIHGLKREGIKIITYDFGLDSFYVSDTIDHFKTLTSYNGLLLDRGINRKYGCGGRMQFAGEERMHEFRVYSVSDSDTVFYTSNLNGKQLLGVNARFNHDGNLVVLGSNSFGNGYQHLDSTFVVVFDKELNVLHNTLGTDRQARVSLHDGMFIDSNNEIVCTHDRRYLIDTSLVGNLPNDDYKRPGVVKFDETGNHLWTIEIGNSINNVNRFGVWNSIIESTDKDGYIIVGGESYQNETGDTLRSDAVIAKISYEGDSLWMRRYSYDRDGSITWDIFKDVHPTSDDGYIAAGWSNGINVDPNPFSYSILMKFDSEGLLDTSQLDNVVSLSAQSDIAVYPNPSDGPIYVSNENVNSGYDIKLISPLGQVLYDFKLKSGYHTIVLDPRHFKSSGVYFLRMKDEAGSISSRQIVISK